MPFTRRTAPLCTWLVAYVLSIAHCTWEPLARPVLPQLVMLGAMRIDGQLEWEARRVIVEETLADSSSRWHLVETDSLSSCTIPEGRPLNIPLLSPGLRGVTDAKLLLPLRRARGDVEDLYLFDEKCALHGPYGEVGGDNPRKIQLKADQRQVLLVLDGKSALRLLDPWTNTTTQIAENVGAYTTIDRGSDRLPEALWLIEGGKLTQRGYDGTLLVSMGQNVSLFVQKFATQESVLRVAYLEGDPEQGGELFEAVSPTYAPVRIASDACGPEYVDTALDVRTPCKDNQLVRIEAGQVRYFERGVHRIYTLGEYRAELVTSPEGEAQTWLARRDGPRIQIVPNPIDITRLTALDSDRYAGRTSMSQVGVWNVRTGGFTAVLSNVRDAWYFPSQRRWLALHDVDKDMQTGKLSSFSESDMFRALQTQSTVTLDTLADGVARGGYNAYPAPGVSEPIIIGCANARVQKDQPTRGTLIARLLSNGLGSLVDENVSLFTLVVAPQPGVLYTITEGPRSGLWFAAL